MKKLLCALSVSALVAVATSAHADESNLVSSSAKGVTESVSGTDGQVRLIPHLGINGFSASDNRNTKQIGQSYGMWVDIGSRDLTFETGLSLISASAEQRSKNNSVEYRVSGAAIPLFVKYNFLGRADSTIYAKGGAMIFPTLAGTGSGNFPFNDIWATAALGGAIPVIQSTSIVLEGNYMKPIGPGSTSIRQFGMEGFSFLAGASIAL